MIPDSAGATPFGIFLLADNYLRAAQVVGDAQRISKGPMRLLCYHAAELFLKAYLRSHGESVADLRGLQHDLAAMIAKAENFGLVLKKRAKARADRIQDQKDYVRVRYMVVDDDKSLLAQAVLAFANDIRSAVRIGLNLDDFGRPQGKHWMADEPADYLAVVNRSRTQATNTD